MIQTSYEEGLESVAALKKVVKRNRNTNLSKAELEENIANNLVAIVSVKNARKKRLGNGLVKYDWRGVVSGTGLKLTTDGFILTAYHNIQPYENDWKKINKENYPTKHNIYSLIEKMATSYIVIDQQKNAYAIDTTIWAANPILDVALIKALTFEKPEASNFRLARKKLKVGDKIKLRGFDFRLITKDSTLEEKINSHDFENKILHNQDGKVISEWYADACQYDTFLTNIRGKGGMSGSAFINSDGELAGLYLYYVLKNKNEQIGDSSGGAKAENIIDFITEAADILNEYVLNCQKKKGIRKFIKLLTKLTNPAKIIKFNYYGTMIINPLLIIKIPEN